jgi:hypothetical protein
MTLLINFKDAVNASVLDPEATVAVFYCDGPFENYAAVRARCPKAKLYAITTLGATGHGIFACDSETGDLSIPRTMQWNAEQVSLGVELIVDYANRNRWLALGLLAAVEAFEKSAGVVIEKWDADFDGSAVLLPWESAKQYATGDVDLDIARATFFEGVTPFTPARGKAEFHGSYDADTGRWEIHGLPGIGFHHGSSKRRACAAIGIEEANGGWLVHSLPYNSPPLGD